MAQKRETDPKKMHWRDRHEYEAKREAEALEPLGERQLVGRIRAERLDPYFAIWRAIGRKGTARGAARELWAFLRDHPGEAWMLHRYHAATALFHILGMDDPASEHELRKRVQWDREGEGARQEALLELESRIETGLHVRD